MIIYKYGIISIVYSKFFIEKNWKCKINNYIYNYIYIYIYIYIFILILYIIKTTKYGLAKNQF